MELNRDTHGHCSVRWSIFQVQYCQMELADGVTGWAFTGLAFTGSFTGLATLQRSDSTALRWTTDNLKRSRPDTSTPSHYPIVRTLMSAMIAPPLIPNAKTDKPPHNRTVRDELAHPPSQTHCMLAVPEEDTVELPTVLCCTDRPHGQSGRKGGSATV